MADASAKTPIDDANTVAVVTATVASTPAATKRPHYSLLIDKRERDVLKHSAEFADIEYDTKQIEIADYIIMNEETVAFAIERKSWNDYAASLKDGRHLNKSKMMSLRQQTGCKVFYIIEGELISSPTKQVGRIPYRAIESSMFHMMVRDNIGVIRTANTLDTAKVLVRFMRSLTTLKDEPAATSAQGLVEGADEDGIPLALTKRVAKSDIDVVRELWSGFRSITACTADYLIEQFSVSEFIRGDIKDIAKIKFSNGRVINKPMAKSLSSINRMVEIRLLSRIPMISLASAKELLKTSRLATLLSYSVEALSMRSIGRSKLGLSKAKNIIKFFNYKKENINNSGCNGDAAAVVKPKPAPKRTVKPKPVPKPAPKREVIEEPPVVVELGPNDPIGYDD